MSVWKCVSGPLKFYGIKWNFTGRVLEHQHFFYLDVAVRSSLVVVQVADVPIVESQRIYTNDAKNSLCEETKRWYIPYRLGGE